MLNPVIIYILSVRNLIGFKCRSFVLIAKEVLASYSYTSRELFSVLKDDELTELLEVTATAPRCFSDLLLTSSRRAFTCGEQTELNRQPCQRSFIDLSRRRVYLGQI